VPAKTNDSEDWSFKKKLKEKASDLKIALGTSSPPITPQANCEERKKGLLDVSQLEKIQMDEDRLNQLASANSFTLFQMPQFGLSSTNMKDPFSSPILSGHITEFAPFYSQFDSFGIVS